MFIKYENTCLLWQNEEWCATLDKNCGCDRMFGRVVYNSKPCTRVTLVSNWYCAHLTERDLEGVVRYEPQNPDRPDRPVEPVPDRLGRQAGHHVRPRDQDRAEQHPDRLAFEVQDPVRRDRHRLVPDDPDRVHEDRKRQHRTRHRLGQRHGSQTPLVGQRPDGYHPDAGQ